MSINKQELYFKNLDIINQRINKYSKELKEKQETSSEEMSNNYEEETGAGEILGDVESISNQLNIAREMKEILLNIDPKKKNQYIGKGSIIETNKTYFFVSVALGKINLDDGSSVYCISSEAPLYKELEGKSPGDSVVFRGETINILNIE
ncbi:MAG TPA: transcription elongation factor [Salinimicrobium sp.]|nr:transcription elongation factor [Salinimicrobium sp.]